VLLSIDGAALTCISFTHKYLFQHIYPTYIYTSRCRRRLAALLAPPPCSAVGLYTYMYAFSEHSCMLILIHTHIYIYIYICISIYLYIYVYTVVAVLDGYCSTVQGLLDWFEVDLGFTELFIQLSLSIGAVMGAASSCIHSCASL